MLKIKNNKEEIIEVYTPSLISLFSHEEEDCISVRNYLLGMDKSMFDFFDAFIYDNEDDMLVALEECYCSNDVEE